MDKEKIFELLVDEKYQTEENREFFNKHSPSRFSVFFEKETLRNTGDKKDPLKLYFQIFSMKNENFVIVDRNILTSCYWEDMLKEDNIELKTKNHQQHFFVRLYSSFFNAAFYNNKKEICVRKLYDLYNEQNYDY